MERGLAYDSGNIRFQVVKNSHGCGVDVTSLQVMQRRVAGQVVCIISKDPSSFIFGVRQSQDRWTDRP